jgi:5-hydroxyisourate hydrolase
LGRLTTHVLDTANGVPAAGVKVTLERVDGLRHERIAETVTNADGRTDAPLLTGAAFQPGTYVLTFDIGAYFAARTDMAEPGFLDMVPIRFRIADEAGHYHVPLLASPWSYSTYRGS